MFKVRAWEARTASWWNDQRDQIDMDPPYQRRANAWSRYDRAFLIDSILNGFDIPKIYMADFSLKDSPLNEAKTLYAVIDGKQRLQAIFEFFDGVLKLESEFEYSLDPSLRLAGMNYHELKGQYPRIAAIFENFNLSVMSVITDEEEKINELFIRLNTSKPLKGAEIRSAMAGLIPPLIERIADHVFFTRRIQFKTDRKQDHNAAAKLLLTEFRGTFAATKKATLDRFVKLGMETEELTEEGVQSESQSNQFDEAAKRCTLVLDKMVGVFHDNDPLLSSEGQLTVYYWLIRETDAKVHPIVRSFLEDFEQQVKAARDLAANNEEADQELLAYYTFSRSSNDAASQTGRYRILRKRLNEYLKAPPKA